MKRYIVTRNLRYIRRRINRNRNKIKLNVVRAAAILFFLLLLLAVNQLLRHDALASFPDTIWQVRSVDTMKTSRDKARERLYDSSYDSVIDKQMTLIKSLGANYVTVDTPYDEEFLPYLKRWVKSARDHNLKVWYRGNWSSWEGWFDYPKNMTPDQLLANTENFIASNKDLFQDGDIFDACPECENSGYWPQTEKNADYNAFLIKKNTVLENSFNKLGKKVIYNWNSIIGGRAKDVLTHKTLDSLGNVIAIDHYAPNASSYEEYINYFDKRNTKVVISEFGAPIPDMHGNMTEEQQANFIKTVLNYFYINKQNVLGINYWAFNLGTTSLYNPDYSPRSVTAVIKAYYSPGVVRGRIKNTLGESLENVSIATANKSSSVMSDSSGNYQIVIPAGVSQLLVSQKSYKLVSFVQKLDYDQSTKRDIILTPTKPDFIYNFRLKVKKIFH